MSTFKVLTKGSLPSKLATSANYCICPTMDIISFQLNSNTLLFYRLNNEKVWDICLNYKDDTNEKIYRICWRPDGKLFAVLSNLGTVSLFDSGSGSLVMQFQVCEGSKNTTEICSWATIENEEGNKPLAGSKYSQIFEGNLVNSLVKLTAGSIVGDDGVLTSEGSALDFLIVVQSHGIVSVILSGAFTIEGYQLPAQTGKALSVLSNPDLVSHYIVMKNDDGSIDLIEFDTTFVSSYGPRLSSISHSCSRVVGFINSLHKYIHLMDDDSKPFFDYTTRIIALLKGEIDERSHAKYNEDPVYDLYDLLLTGSLSEATKTWLTDYLGDRGVKRWQKLGDKHFGGSRKILFYSMIPTLQHLIIHLTKLEGLSKWEETRNLLGLDSQQIAIALQTASDFLKECYKTMMSLNENQKNFESVMKWFNDIIQELTTDEKPATGIDTKNIIDFLLSLSHKDGPEHKNDLLEKLYGSLQKHMDTIFQQIKEKMKTEMKSKLLIKLSDSIGDATEFDTTLDNGIFEMAILSAGRVTVTQFDTSTSQKKVHVLKLQENQKGLGIKIMKLDKIMLLCANGDNRTLVSLKINEDANSNDIVQGGADIDKIIQVPMDDDFKATYLTNNSHRKTCSVLDDTKKNYYVLEYDT